MGTISAGGEKRFDRRAIEPLAAIGDCSGGENRREVEKVRSDNALAHGFEQVGDAAAPDKRVRCRLEIQGAKNTMDPRQKSVFGAHVPKLGVVDDMLRKGKRCEILPAVNQPYFGAWHGNSSEGHLKPLT